MNWGKLLVVTKFLLCICKVLSLNHKPRKKEFLRISKQTLCSLRDHHQQVSCTKLSNCEFSNGVPGVIKVERRGWVLAEVCRGFRGQITRSGDVHLSPSLCSAMAVMGTFPSQKAANMFLLISFSWRAPCQTFMSTLLEQIWFYLHLLRMPM